MKNDCTSAISQQARELLEFAKTTTVQNITTAVASRDIPIERTLLPKLLLLVQQSLDQGAENGRIEFERKISTLLKSEESLKKK